MKQTNTNQLQHPWIQIGAAHETSVHTKPIELVLIEPLSVHSTHTHFCQTNYCRGPSDHETRVCFYVPPRVVQVGGCCPRSTHLFTTPFNSLFDYVRWQSVWGFIESHGLRQVFCYVKTSRHSGDSAGDIVSGWRGTGEKSRMSRAGSRLAVVPLARHSSGGAGAASASSAEAAGRPHAHRLLFFVTSRCISNPTTARNLLR